MGNITIGNNWEIVICEFAKFVVIQSLFNLFPQTNHTWYNEGWIESNTWQYYFVLFSIIALLWVSFVRLFVLIYSGLDPMAFYENYFGVPYPYSKYDMIFLPSFSFNAMENPGCVAIQDKNFAPYMES